MFRPSYYQTEFILQCYNEKLVVEYWPRRTGKTQGMLNALQFKIKNKPGRYIHFSSHEPNMRGNINDFLCFHVVQGDIKKVALNEIYFKNGSVLHFTYLPRFDYRDLSRYLLLYREMFFDIFESQYDYLERNKILQKAQSNLNSNCYIIC